MHNSPTNLNDLSKVVDEKLADLSVVKLSPLKTSLLNEAALRLRSDYSIEEMREYFEPILTGAYLDYISLHSETPNACAISVSVIIRTDEDPMTAITAGAYIHYEFTTEEKYKLEAKKFSG